MEGSTKVSVSRLLRYSQPARPPGRLARGTHRKGSTAMLRDHSGDGCMLRRANRLRCLEASQRKARGRLGTRPRAPCPLQMRVIQWLRRSAAQSDQDTSRLECSMSRYMSDGVAAGGARAGPGAWLLAESSARLGWRGICRRRPCSIQKLLLSVKAPKFSHP